MRMTRIKLIAFASALLLGMYALSWSAYIPQLFNFQGRVTDENGRPRNGTVQLGFRLYTTVSGGTQIWEETYPSAQIVNGVVVAQLGTLTPIPVSVFSNNASVYLATVINGTELAPRQQLLSVPYAFAAETVRGSGSVSASTAVFTGWISASSATIQDLTVSSLTATTTGANPENVGLRVSSSAYLATSGGFLGIGTTSPNAKLDIGGLSGTAASNAIRVHAGSLGTTAGNRLKLASFGFQSINQSSLGIEALRRADGATWDTTAIGLKMDVDNTSPVGNTQIWFSTYGAIGVGTENPTSTLDVYGNISAAWSILSSGSNAIFRQGAHFMWNKDNGGGSTWIINQKGEGSIAGFKFGESDLSNNFRETFRISEFGDIGIGTSDPANDLEVIGGISASSITLSGLSADPSGPVAGSLVYRSDTGEFKAKTPAGWVVLSTVSAASETALNVSASTQTKTGGLVLNGNLVTNGRIGIGTTNPQYKLDVHGPTGGGQAIVAGVYPSGVDHALSIYSLNTNASIDIGLDGSGSTYNSLVQAGDSRIIFRDDGNIGGGNLVIGPWGGAYGLRILGASGNVGIGTALPGATLGVAGSIDASSAAFTTTGSSSENVGLRVSSSAYLATSGGFLGIGTTTPSEKLQVVGNISAAGVIYGIRDSFYNAENGALKAVNATTPAKYVDIGYDGTDDVGFIQPAHNGGAWKNLSLNPAGGNVGIGSLTPAYKLDVVGGVRASTITLTSQAADPAISADGSIFYNSTLNNLRVRLGSNWLTLLTTSTVNGGLDVSASTQTKKGGLTVIGHVGIGTVSPDSTYALSVYPYGSSPAIYVGPSDSGIEGAEIGWAGSGSYPLWTTDVYAGKFRMFMNSTDADNTNQVQIYNYGSGVAGLYVEGNVGIGTDNPGNDLEVIGGITASSITLSGLSADPSGPVAGSLVYRSDTGEFKAKTPAGWVVLSTVSAASDTALNTTASTQTKTGGINLSGKLSLGSQVLDSASGLLDLSDANVAGVPSIFFREQGSDAYGAKIAYDNGSDFLKLFGVQNYVEKLGIAIHRSGSVGIKTTSIGNDLDVNGGITASSVTLSGLSADPAGPAAGSLVYRSDTGEFKAKTPAGWVVLSTVSAASDTALNTTASTQTKTGGLTIGGRMGIGTTSPAFSLDVVGSVRVPAPSSYYVGGQTDAGVDGLRLTHLSGSSYIDNKGTGDLSFRNDNSAGGTSAFLVGQGRNASLLDFHIYGSGNKSLGLWATDAGADKKRSKTYIQSDGTLVWSLINDADSYADTWLTLTRTTTTPNTLTLDADNILLKVGNPGAVLIDGANSGLGLELKDENGFSTVQAWGSSQDLALNPAGNYVGIGISTPLGTLHISAAAGSTGNQLLVSTGSTNLLTITGLASTFTTPLYAYGGLYWGNSYSRTQTRDDAGLQGNAGAQSGFFETNTPVNYPSGASSWWHLLDVRHNNPENNYAMQFAGSFFDNDLYFRKTIGAGNNVWNKVVLADYLGNVTISTLTVSNQLSAGAYAVVGGIIDRPFVVAPNTYDGLTIGANADNQQAIQTFIDTKWLDRSEYAPTANVLQLQPDAGVVGIGMGTVAPSYALDVYGTFRSTSTTILAANNGNVGIGTTGPSAKLHIAGAAGDAGHQLIISTGTTTLFALTGSSVSFGSSISTISANKFQANQGFHTNGTFAPITDQGAYFQWNRLCNPGTCDGATYIVNQKGLGSGGIILGKSDPNNSFTEQMRIADGGNVGIGTDAPTATLQIGATGIGTFGGLAIGAAADREIRIGQDSTHNLIMAWKYNATAANAYSLIENYGGNNPLALQLTGGNVGVGTAGPTSKLDVFAGSITVRGTNAGLHIADPQTSPSGRNLIQVSTNSNIAFLINDTGNVGVGTIAPAEKLHVNGGIKANTLTLVTNAGTNVENLAEPTTITHNLGLSCFQAVTVSNGDHAANGFYVIGVGNIGANSFDVHIVGGGIGNPARFNWYIVCVE